MIRIADDREVRDVISGLRADARLSQQALVEASGNGFTQQQLNRWENGRFRPSVQSLIRVANALGYDLALVPREDA